MFVGTSAWKDRVGNAALLLLEHDAVAVFMQRLLQWLWVQFSEVPLEVPAADSLSLSLSLSLGTCELPV